MLKNWSMCLKLLSCSTEIKTPYEEHYTEIREKCMQPIHPSYQAKNSQQSKFEEVLESFTSRPNPQTPFIIRLAQSKMLTLWVIVWTKAMSTPVRFCVHQAHALTQMDASNACIKASPKLVGNKELLFP